MREKEEFGGLQKKRALSTAQIIALGFFGAILAGSFVLCLPVCSAEGTWTPYVDALFTSASSVCVTGLTVMNTATDWSLFGQIVILLLIQCGGLGIITFVTFLMMLIGHKVTLSDRLLIEDAFNLNTLRGLIRFLKKVLLGTFVIEGIGAVCYMLVFVPEYGAIGIWYAVFHAVSAFCNAGMDIIGSNSMMNYVTHPWMNLVTMVLTIMGGIGFVVWWDVLKVMREIRNGDVARSFFFGRLKLHTKLVLCTTAVLILGGAILILAFEYSNPETLGGLSFGNKIMAAFFQSVTFRTTGFVTVSQSGLQDGTVLLGTVLRMIGGSPVGTASGIKTTTIAVAFFTIVATIRGREHVTVFGRTIPERTCRKAVSVVLVFASLLLVMIMLMSVIEPGSMKDVAFETVGALSTVGISRGYTHHLSLAGRLIIILCMYIGRVGPISMALAFGFNQRKVNSRIRYPEEDITIG